MTVKEFIVSQLEATHTQKNWFVPINDAIAGMTAEDAARKDTTGSHSVWELVNHLIFWNGRWLTRLRGEVPPEMKTENSGTFVNGIADESGWQEACRRLENICSEIEEQVKALSDEDLDKEAFPGYGGSLAEVFCQMTIHNAYHSGQIVLQRKQQGSWDTQQGVS
jgi:uncharacterized damage-inducible protein DinB